MSEIDASKVTERTGQRARLLSRMAQWKYGMPKNPRGPQLNGNPWFVY
jgi:hypothetical protein